MYMIWLLRWKAYCMRCRNQSLVVACYLCLHKLLVSNFRIEFLDLFCLNWIPRLRRLISVLALTAGRIDDRGTRVQLRPIEERIAEAKQLKALRLLCLLLPETHARLFQRLLRLLKNTLAYSDLNRMTAESLGTLFGPLLLSPGKVSWDLRMHPVMLCLVMAHPS